MVRVLSKVFACYILLAMNQLVAIIAKGNNITKVKAQTRISRPRFQVVSMQPFALGLWRAAATALKVIALVYRQAKLSPMALFIKALAFWRCAAFPCRVFVSNLTAHVCSTRTANRNIETVCELSNSTRMNPKLFGDILHCAIVRYIGMVEPSRIMIRLSRMIVLRQVWAPLVLMVTPNSEFLTAALAYGCSTDRKINNWFTAFAMSMSLLSIADGYTMLAKDVTNSRRRYTKPFG